MVEKLTVERKPGVFLKSMEKDLLFLFSAHTKISDQVELNINLFQSFDLDGFL